MSVAPTANDVEVVYTSRALVEAYLPEGLIVTGSANPGSVTVTALNDIIHTYSREIDAKLRAKGFECPFPDVTASNPECPRMIVRACTYLVVGEVRTISKFGNRKAASASMYLDDGNKIINDLLRHPTNIGYGRVSTPEQWIDRVADVGTNQWGKLTATYYRLANRNLKSDTLRFVNADGVEVFRPDGLPFDYGRDWAVVSYAESIIILLNESQMIAQCGPGGGCVYEFSWRRYMYGQGHPQPITGVTLLGTPPA